MFNTPCPNCGGKGWFNTWSKPCTEGDMHKKKPCTLCQGTCIFNGPAEKCPQCKGHGGFNSWDKPARNTDMHYKRDCPSCSGRGWGTGQPAYPPAPAPQPGYPPAPVPQLAGTWVDSANAADVITVTQNGNMMTASNTAPWSPASGMVEAGGRVVFQTGLQGITAQYDGRTQELSFSNGCKWLFRGASRSVPVPQLAGTWVDSANAADVITVTQNGNTMTARNNAPWSPANGVVEESGRVVFQTGLQGITAQYDSRMQELSFSNGCKWLFRGSSDRAPPPGQVTQLAGFWRDPKTASDEMIVITQNGNLITVADPRQSWSPAHGSIAGGKVTFSQGLVGLEASIVSPSELRFSNGAVWARDLPNIHGPWNGPNGVVTVTQTGTSLRYDAPQHANFPLFGEVKFDTNAQRPVIRIDTVSGTLDEGPGVRYIRWSNNTTWQQNAAQPIGSAPPLGSMPPAEYRGGV